MTRPGKAGRPPIGGRLARVQLTAEQDAAVEHLVTVTGGTWPQVLRDLLDAGLRAGMIRSGRWTYGPARQDGQRYRWPEGYFDLTDEEAQKYLDD